MQKAIKSLFLLCLFLNSAAIAKNHDGLVKKDLNDNQRNISFDFQKINIRDALKIFADFSKFNVVVSDSVQGDVTLKLDNVPFEKALDLVLISKGLAKRQFDNVILVGTSDEILARETLALENKNNKNQLKKLHTVYFKINFAKAKTIANMLHAQGVTLLSTRGNVSADERTNTLLVQDTMDKIAEIKNLIKELDVPVPQVEIKMHIIESQVNIADELGIDIGGAAKVRFGKKNVLFSGADSVIGSSSAGNNASISSQSNSLLRKPLTMLPLVSPEKIMGRLGISVFPLPGGTLLDLELKAFEQEKKLRTVARPNLVTSNQATASLEQGVELPYIETASSKSGAATVSFKKAVLKLEVTPQISPNDTIFLDLNISQDTKGEDVVTAGLSNFSINTKNMRTKVLVKDGETIVLGGIYTDRKNNVRNSVPFFSKIPILGNFFKSKTDVLARTEIIIFVTPKIIKSVV